MAAAAFRAQDMFGLRRDFNGVHNVAGYIPVLGTVSAVGRISTCSILCAQGHISVGTLITSIARAIFEAIPLVGLVVFLPVDLIVYCVKKYYARQAERNQLIQVLQRFPDTLIPGRLHDDPEVRSAAAQGYFALAAHLCQRKQYTDAEQVYFRAHVFGRRDAFLHAGHMFEARKEAYRIRVERALNARNDQGNRVPVSEGIVDEQPLSQMSHEEACSIENIRLENWCKRAEEYYMRAVDEGSVEAMVCLGALLKRGALAMPWGKEAKDLETRAFQLQSRAADAGNLDALVHLGELVENKIDRQRVLAEDTEPSDTSRIQEALDFYRRAADGGNQKGAWALVRLCAANDVFPGERNAYLKQLADSGDQEAQFQMAQALEEEGESNHEEAIRYFTLAAAPRVVRLTDTGEAVPVVDEGGSGLLPLLVARCYREGSGVRTFNGFKFLEEAVDHSALALEAQTEKVRIINPGHFFAQEYLASYYEKVSPDSVQAKYYRRLTEASED